VQIAVCAAIFFCRNGEEVRFDYFVAVAAGADGVVQQTVLAESGGKKAGAPKRAGSRSHMMSSPSTG
jgi:hypothetical protein